MEFKKVFEENKTYFVIGGVVFVLALVGGGYLLLRKKKTKSDDVLIPSSSTPISASSLSATSPVADGGNDYVSAATVAKRKNGNYEAWNTNPIPMNKIAPNAVAGVKDRDKSTPEKKARWDSYDSYWGTIKPITGFDPAVEEGYVSGFMKGMNLAQTRANVIAFKQDIIDYVKSPTKTGHWEVSVGQFSK